MTFQQFSLKILFFSIQILHIFPLPIRSEALSSHSWNCLLKCGQTLDFKFLSLCLEKSYIIPLTNIFSEEKAFQECSYYFDNTHESFYQESKKFCLEMGCYAPISKEILPPEFDIKNIQKLNEYSFVQKKDSKAKERKNLGKTNKKKKILMDNGILDEMDEGLKQARDNICNKNNKHEDFFIELKNIQTKAIKDPKISLIKILSIFIRNRLADIGFLVDSLSENELSTLNNKFNEVIEVLLKQKASCNKTYLT